MKNPKSFTFDNTKRFEKLSKDTQEDLLFDLVSALVQTNNIDEAALFLQDLLTKTEIKILSKRLRIAKLLVAGMTYEEIEKELHVSHSTVAKIATWLSERGEGFRNIIKKLPKQKREKPWQEFSEWDRIKRKYPSYFWPELLLEEIIKSTNKKQKQRIRNVLNTVEEKSKLYKQIEKYLSH